MQSFVSKMLCALALSVVLAAEPVAEPAPKTHHEKSVSMLFALLEVGVGAAAGYVALFTGLGINNTRGGLSWPPDGSDVLLMGVLPALLVAGGSFSIGLLDLRQRGIFSSALYALLGTSLGGLVGFALGYFVGRGVHGSDNVAAQMMALAFAPAFAAIGSTTAMELFKSGREVEDAPGSTTFMFAPSLVVMRGRPPVPMMSVSGRF